MATFGIGNSETGSWEGRAVKKEVIASRDGKDAKLHGSFSVGDKIVKRPAKRNQQKYSLS